MSREGANRLRRSPHGAAFARAWDAARHHAGGVIEDIAFERALEGVEHNVYNEYGEVICTKRVHNDRLLMFLLRHLKPERYATDAPARPAPPPLPVDAAFCDMEPLLPAPPEQLLGEDGLAEALDLADAADGVLPRFLSEQRPPKTPEQEVTEAHAAQEARGEAAWRKEGPLSNQEFADMCRYVDPASRSEPPRKRYR